MKNHICIDGNLIRTEVKEITGANVLTVEAGTNGYKGSDCGAKAIIEGSGFIVDTLKKQSKGDAE